MSRVRLQRHVRHRRRQELLEDRQRRGRWRSHRRLEAALRLRAERVRSIARLIAWRTASWLVGNLVRFGSRLFVWIGANHTLWVGVAADERLLDAGDEVAGPVELVGLQRRQRRVGRCVGRELRPSPTGRLAAPVARVGLQREALRAELSRPCTARCRPGSCRRTCRDRPTLLQIDCGTMYVWPAMFCRFAYCGEEKLTSTWLPHEVDARDRQARRVDVGVLLDHVVGERDVGGGQRRAV